MSLQSPIFWAFLVGKWWGYQPQNSIWNQLTFDMSQSQSWQHSGTMYFQLANILMCTGISFNQLFSQTFLFTLLWRRLVCEKVSISLLTGRWWDSSFCLCLNLKDMGTHKQCTSQASSPLLTKSRISRLTQGSILCNWDSQGFVADEECGRSICISWTISVFAQHFWNTQ